MERTKRQLVLNKENGEAYIFRYEEGEEEEVIMVAAEWSEKLSLSFDLIDATTVSRKMWRALIDRADRLLEEGWASNITESR